MVSEQFEESKAPRGADEAFGGDRVWQCGSMEEKGESCGGGVEALDEFELVEAEFAV